MSNSILTPTAVTRECQRILHRKLNFIGNINRQYDDSFGRSGAKQGDSLKIRLPNEYSVRSGKVATVQDTSEESVTLTVATQNGIDMAFSSAELALSLDDFSDRIIKPAMARLASHMEADALSMYKQVYNEVSDVGASLAVSNVLAAQKKLTDCLAPDGDRTLLLTTQNNVDLVTAQLALFNDRSKVSEQYRKGLIGNDFFGFDNVYQNTLLPLHTTGTTTDSSYYTDIAAGEADGSAGLLHIDTGSGTLVEGDIIMIEGVYAVHPESKVSTGKLKQFVVTANKSTGEGDLSISPSIVSSGARQNVNAAAADGKKIYKRESDESTVITTAADYYVGLAFHKDAFAFVSADLDLPSGCDWAARERQDGISMRLIRDYDVVNDNWIARLDVLYGFKAIRPQLACRIGFN